MKEITNIYLVGPMGSGKTTIGNELAKELDLNFYDSDKEIELKTGVEIPYIFEKEGEVGFRIREMQIIQDLTKLKSIVLSTGGGSIISEKVRENLKNTGIIIFLEASIEKQLLQTSYNDNRPLLEDGDKRSNLEKIYRLRKPIYKNISDIEINTNDKNIKLIIADIKKKLNRFKKNHK
tara:strand:- start:5321 stop:5854 length:534 start_codon:yes stop_codon:yes gene_type:complete